MRIYALALLASASVGAAVAVSDGLLRSQSNASSDDVVWSGFTWDFKEGVDNDGNYYTEVAVTLDSASLTLTVSPPAKGQLPALWQCAEVDTHTNTTFGKLSFLINSDLSNFTAVNQALVFEMGVVGLVSVDGPQEDIMRMSVSGWDAGNNAQLWWKADSVNRTVVPFSISTSSATLWQLDWTSDRTVVFRVNAVNVTNNAVIVGAEIFLHGPVAVFSDGQNTHAMLRSYLKGALPAAGAKVDPVSVLNFTYIKH